MLAGVFFLMTLFSCNSDKPYEANIDKLVDKNNHYDSLLLRELKREGLKIVPSLIKVIDKEGNGFFGLCYSWESDYSSLISYVGVRAAYMIEYLLYDSVEIRQKCGRRSIVKRDTTYGINIMPELEDMSKLKQIYKNWWDTNKGKTLLELQEIYKERRILDSSRFYWQ